MCQNCQKMKKELAELREFKRKHDQDLKKLVGSSFTWNELQGKVTLGCIRNF